MGFIRYKGKNKECYYQYKFNTIIFFCINPIINIQYKKAK